MRTIIYWGLYWASPYCGKLPHSRPMVPKSPPLLEACGGSPAKGEWEALQSSPGRAECRHVDGWSREAVWSSRGLPLTCARALFELGGLLFELQVS